MHWTSGTTESQSASRCFPRVWTQPTCLDTTIEVKHETVRRKNDRLSFAAIRHGSGTHGWLEHWCSVQGLPYSSAMKRSFRTYIYRKCVRHFPSSCSSATTSYIPDTRFSFHSHLQPHGTWASHPLSAVTVVTTAVVVQQQSQWQPAQVKSQSIGRNLHVRVQPEYTYSHTYSCTQRLAYNIQPLDFLDTHISNRCNRCRPSISRPIKLDFYCTKILKTVESQLSPTLYYFASTWWSYPIAEILRPSYHIRSDLGNNNNNNIITTSTTFSSFSLRASSIEDAFRHSEYRFVFTEFDHFCFLLAFTHIDDVQRCKSHLNDYRSHSTKADEYTGNTRSHTERRPSQISLL